MRPHTLDYSLVGVHLALGTIAMCSALCSPSVAQAVDAPEGWTVRSVGKAGEQTHVYRPEDRRAASGFFIAVHDSERLDGASLTSWLESLRDRLAKRLQQVRSKGHVQPFDNWKQRSKSPLSVLVRHTPKLGVDRHTQLLAFPIGDDAAAWMRIDFDAVEDYKTQKDIIAKLIPKAFLEQATKDAVATAKQEAEKSAEQKVREQHKQREEQLARARIATEGEAVPDDLLLGVLYHFDTRMTAYGNLEPVVTTHLLLGDGTAYRNPTLPPEHFAYERSRKLEPERWITWRRNVAGVFEARDSEDGAWLPLPGHLVRPVAEKHVDLDLSHLAVWGNTFMGGGHTRSYVHLKRDGRFETSKSALAMSGEGARMAGLGTTTTATSHDKDGSKSVSSSKAGSAYVGAKSTKNDGGSDRTGTYSIEGYSIEFHHDSGRVSWAIISWPNEGDDRIYLDGRVFTNRNSASRQKDAKR
ncbi:MAG: hypothetical protein KDC95_14480 [Planctomycetes bacterium]|nr:hypothetical protein [Planctomycetota bacterium]